ncbi:MAG: GHKL domain-containing protein [Bacilli bacterium]|nr:GHKL domain-containing protein [Bacilli bacterium]
MIEKFMYYLIPSLINFIGVMYIQYKIMDKKLDFRNRKIFIGLLLFLFLNIINYVFVTGFLRFVLSLIYICFISTYIFKEKMYLTFSVTILEQTIYFIAELLCAVLFSIFKINMLTLSSYNFLNFIILNLVITIIAVLIYKIKFVSNLCNKLLNYLNKFNGINKLVIVFIFFITMNVLLMLTYFSSESKYIIVINSIFIVVYSVIIYMLIIEKNQSIKYKEQNEILLDNLSDYEKMLDYQRVNNHENKNQLLVIRSMISKNNTKALDYLDEVINEKRKDDEGLYTYAKTIPEGGLQGLVYQKMLKMKKNNIKINLNVNRKIRKVNFDNISSKTNYDLCRVVGIILDNAIEEVMKLEDKEILISMYKDTEYFIIEVSNKCESIPDLSKLDEKGYTTKSEGHGYGLSLLKEIIGNNDTFINERSINKNIFTQIIKIKM